MPIPLSFHSYLERGTGSDQEANFQYYGEKDLDHCGHHCTRRMLQVLGSQAASSGREVYTTYGSCHLCDLKSGHGCSPCVPWLCTSPLPLETVNQWNP